MRFRVAMTLVFVGRKAAEGEEAYASLEDFLDAVMEELLALGLQEPSIGGSLASGEVEISTDVDSDSPEKAVVYGVSSFRSAIHAAYGDTPDWPTHFVGIDVRPVEDEISEFQPA